MISTYTAKYIKIKSGYGAVSRVAGGDNGGKNLRRE